MKSHKRFQGFDSRGACRYWPCAVSDWEEWRCTWRCCPFLLLWLVNRSPAAAPGELAPILYRVAGSCTLGRMDSGPPDCRACWKRHHPVVSLSELSVQQRRI